MKSNIGWEHLAKFKVTGDSAEKSHYPVKSLQKHLLRDRTNNVHFIGPVVKPVNGKNIRHLHQKYLPSNKVVMRTNLAASAPGKTNGYDQKITNVWLEILELLLTLTLVYPLDGRSNGQKPRYSI